MEKDIEENALQEIKTHDDILMQWADKAAIYSRLYSIPEINIFEYISLIGATINSIVNFIITLLPDDRKILALYIMGFINIICITLAGLYKIIVTPPVTIRAEHKFAAISWSKLNRNIKVELSKYPEDRDKNMLTIFQNEFDKLMEASPILSEKVIKKFQKEYGNNN